MRAGNLIFATSQEHQQGFTRDMWWISRWFQIIASEVRQLDQTMRKERVILQCPR